MARKKNEQTMTFEEFKEEVKEGNVAGVDAPEELTPFAEMLKKHSDDFEGCSNIDTFCEMFQMFCEENGFWDKRRKEYVIRLRRAGKVDIAFLMVWNWILAGVVNKTYSAR